MEFGPIGSRRRRAHSGENVGSLQSTGSPERFCVRKENLTPTQRIRRVPHFSLWKSVLLLTMVVANVTSLQRRDKNDQSTRNN